MNKKSRSKWITSTRKLHLKSNVDIRVGVNQYDNLLSISFNGTTYIMTPSEAEVLVYDIMYSCHRWELRHEK